MRFVLVLALVVLLPSAGIPDEWDRVREEQIEPLNSMLHGYWPSLIRDRKLEALTRLYATETGTGLTWEGAELMASEADERTLRWQGPPGEEPIRERYARLLEHFVAFERVELRIDRIDWDDYGPLGYPATVRLIVRGTGPDGERRQLEQHATLGLRRYDPFWEIAAEEVTARSLVSLAAPRFASVGEAAGIRSVHANQLSPIFRIFGPSDDNPVRQASGAAVGDINGDGCEDVLLTGSPELVLYRSRCDGSFEDVTLAVGLPRPYPAAASGAVFFDYDNDGWQDVYIAAVRGGDRLFRNQHGERFVDVTASAGVPSGVWGSMPAVADYDRDGFLDIYVARMGDHEKSSPSPPYAAANGVRGTLLHNLRNGRFEEVSAGAGVDSPGWDMAAAWGDYDADGWPDLYVANEFGANHLYRNEGDGSFSDRTQESGTTDGGSGMSVAWGDYDADGDLDLFVSGMHANSGWTMFHPSFPTMIPWYFRLLGRFTDAVHLRADEITDGLSRGSTLYRNEGDGRFVDVSEAAGVRDGQWGWGAQFLDYDNDGRLDLYATNGFISGPLLDDV